MRLLLIHADFLEFVAKEKTGAAEEISEDRKSGRAEETLVAFIAVEESDESDPDSIIKRAYDEINEVLKKVNAESVVIYPYAHLSQSLSSPEAATEVLKGIQERFEEEGIETLRPPFGWYKKFNLSCKGHPLSELSRSITLEEEKEREAEEEEIRSDWIVIDEEGEEHDPASFDASADFRKIIRSELEGTEEKGKEPPHVGLMTEKEIADYEDLSDAGNLRWYPRGKLVRDLLIKYVNRIVSDYGAMKVETPIMYDLGNKSVSEHSDKFGERQYRLESGSREMVLRFAACFGMFSIMNDMYLDMSDLPLRMYELSTYSFRREQRGEIVGLRRQRAFTMPDLHTACADLEEARKEFGSQVLWTLKTEKDLDLNYQVIFRTTKKFYEDNEDWIKTLVHNIGRPTLVEILEGRKHYWAAKCDLAALDAHGRPLENPTVQIDVESADRFDISFYDDEEEKKPPILHTSPTGSIERVLCAILESISITEKPQFPVWLSPTQVRLVPVGEEHVETCTKIVEKLASHRVRADIDDRDRTVGKRIRKAEKDWVPYTIVFGDREKDSEKLPVRVRKEGEEIDMSIGDLKERLAEETQGKPFLPLPVPRKLSDRPSFVG